MTATQALAAAIAVGLGSDRGEEEQQPRPIRGDEVRLAARQGDHAGPDHRRPVGRARHGHAQRGSGARALGLDAACGSLEVGKRADIITVDLRQLDFTPLRHGRHSNVAAHLVFSASGNGVRHVWVDGRLLVDDGNALSVDVDRVIADAQAAAEELFARRDAMMAARDA